MGFFSFFKDLFEGIFDFGKQIVRFIKDAFINSCKRKMQENAQMQADQAMIGSRRTFVTPAMPVYGYQTPVQPQFTQPQVQRPITVTPPPPPVEDVLKWNDGMSAPKPPVYTVPNTGYSNYMYGAYPCTNRPSSTYGMSQTRIPTQTYQYNPQDELKWHENPNRQRSYQTASPWENMTIKGSIRDLFNLGKPKSNPEVNKPNITSGFTTMSSMTSNSDNGVVCAFAPKSNYVGNTKG